MTTATTTPTAVRDAIVPLIDVGMALAFRDEPANPEQCVVLLIESEGGGRAALLVDDIQGQRQVVIKSLEAEQTTASGLVIPDTAKEKPQEGEVLAVGPGRWNEDGDERIPLDVKVGDRVIYSKYGGTEIKHGGQEYLILSARDVLAIVG